MRREVSFVRWGGRMAVVEIVVQNFGANAAAKNDFRRFVEIFFIYYYVKINASSIYCPILLFIHASKPA